MTDAAYRNHNGFAIGSAKINPGYLIHYCKSKRSMNADKWDNKAFDYWIDYIAFGDYDMDSLMEEGLQLSFVFSDETGFTDSAMAPMCQFE